MASDDAKKSSALKSWAFRRLNEHLETALFSLETVQMALTTTAPRSPMSIKARQSAPSADERNAGKIAANALEHARDELVELSKSFELPSLFQIGLAIGFWSNLQWCWERLFTESAQHTGAVTLNYELAEARRRIEELRTRLQLQLIDEVVIH